MSASARSRKHLRTNQNVEFLSRLDKPYGFQDQPGSSPFLRLEVRGLHDDRYPKLIIHQATAARGVTESYKRTDRSASIELTRKIRQRSVGPLVGHDWTKSFFFFLTGSVIVNPT